MRIAWRIGLALTLALFASFTVALAAPAPKTAASIYKENIGRVVTIQGDMLGTGFVLASGLLVTNAHVVGNASLVQVETQDGQSYKAEVVKKDISQDFAILQFDRATIKPFFNLIPIQHAGTPEIGEGVVIIGSPLGLRGTATTGIVSQVYPNGLIQLNASVNPGNSGGPVFDMQGRVFGIATLKVQQTPDGKSVDGLGIAIPIGWLDAY